MKLRNVFYWILVFLTVPIVAQEKQYRIVIEPGVSPSKPYTWTGNDVPIGASFDHDRAPSIIAQRPGNEQDMYIAYERWSGTSHPDRIRIVRSSNYGQSWDADAAEINDSDNLYLPSLACTNNSIFTVFNLEWASNDFDICVAKCPANDLLAGSWNVIDDSIAHHIRPVIATDYAFYPGDPYVHLAYLDYTTSTGRVVYRRTEDLGSSWTARNHIASFTIAEAEHLDMTLYLNTIGICYTTDVGGDDDVYFVRSTNGGNTFSSPIALFATLDHERYPSIGIHGNTIVVVAEKWISSSNRDVVYRYSTDAGVTWSATAAINGGELDQRYARCRGDITNSSDEIAISYADLSANKVYVGAGTGSPAAWSFHHENSYGNPISSGDLTSSTPLIHFSTHSEGIAWVELDPGNGDYDLLFDADYLTDIERNESRIPRFELIGNHPNPFNPSTEIRFSLAEAGHAEVVLYNAVGQQIKRLVSDRLDAGQHAVRWNAEGYASGVYFCRLESSGRSQIIKMVLIK